MEWGVLAQRSMSPRFIIIARIGLQVPAQVRLAQYDQMVERVTTDRPDQAFGKGGLPKAGLGR
jgi:hypothetical protein